MPKSKQYKLDQKEVENIMESTTIPKQQPLERQEEAVFKKILLELKSYLEALIVAFLIVTFAFNTVGVVGSSMRPNLNGGVGRASIIKSLFTGDRVFIPKYDTWLRRMGILGNYQRGDIVVVREPANAPSAVMGERRQFFIKRVIAVPGDHLRIDAGQVYVNNYPIDQSFISSSGEITPDPIYFPLINQANGQVNQFYVDWIDTSYGTKYPSLPYENYIAKPWSVSDKNVQLYYGKVLDNLAIPKDAQENTAILVDLVIPKDHYFLMGDNREASRGGSEDSRYFGPITSMSIAGKATAVIWPPKREGQWNWRSLKPPADFANIPNPQ